MCSPRQDIRLALVFLCVLPVTVALSGCGDRDLQFSAMLPVQQTTGDCNVTLLTTNANLRILFMVDDSGSTGGTTGTDPGDQIRVATIQSFLKTYGAKSNFSYAFGYFNANALMFDYSNSKFQSSPVSFFGSASQLPLALTTFEKIVPDGSTGYTGAFSLLQSAVSSDVKSGAQQDYAVVFMSDGMPTDLLTNQIDPSINTMVANLIKAAGSSSLTVSSVYFGPEASSDAIEHLQNMATKGGGVFVDTNQTAALNIDQLIPVPVTSNSCH